MFFLCGPHQDYSQLRGNTPLQKQRAVFSVLLGPCQGNITESNSEARSCRSAEEYKEYNREVEMYNPVVDRG